MLIERMHTNPEDFEYGGKLHGIVSDRELSERDHTAINRANEALIKEPKLMERVITALLAQPEQEEIQYKTFGQPRINSSLYTTGFSDPRLLQNGPGVSFQDLQPYRANIQIGRQTLTENMIKTLKQKMGL